MEKGFEKIILQFTTDFENTLLKKGGLIVLCLVYEKLGLLIL